MLFPHAMATGFGQSAIKTSRKADKPLLAPFLLTAFLVGPLALLVGLTPVPRPPVWGIFAPRGQMQRIPGTGPWLRDSVRRAKAG